MRIPWGVVRNARTNTRREWPIVRGGFMCDDGIGRFRAPRLHRPRRSDAAVARPCVIIVTGACAHGVNLTAGGCAMKYAAFFRGVNVGGKNRVNMAELQRLFFDCGFFGVRTYIQSGNVLFETDGPQNALTELIQKAFARRFGFESSVVLRAEDEIAGILAALPFTQEDLAKAEVMSPGVEHAYVYLSNAVIAPAIVEKLLLSCREGDKLYAGKRELYLLFGRGARGSGLAAALPKLDPSLTARNINTMRKIQSLLGSGACG